MVSHEASCLPTFPVVFLSKLQLKGPGAPADAPSLQYRAIEDSAYEAFYKLTDPVAQIKSYVYDVVRASVPKVGVALKHPDCFLEEGTCV